MPLSRRLPKRGFRNVFKKEILVVNLGRLNSFPEGSTVDMEALLKAGILKKTGDGVKILGKGSINGALKLKVNMISRTAKEKVEAAGGSVEVI